MLIQLMMTPLWVLVYALIGLFPVLSSVPVGFEAILNIIGYGCAFIGTDFFLAVIGNIVFWLTAQMSWSIIEWVYKKIPGVS